MKEQANKLCVRKEKDGTLDIWICPEGKEDRIIITYNGKPIEEIAYDMPITPGAIDNYMGTFGRDVENWYYKDIVIHWGVNTWKFYNSKNVTDIEKDEYVKNLDDIEYFYDVEW